MSKKQIKQLIEQSIEGSGMIQTAVEGVQIFRFSDPLRCAPAVYEPSVIAIVSGEKEAILDGTSYVYDDMRYLCCAMSMPVEAGIRSATPENPLMGVYISLETSALTELTIETENARGAIARPKSGDLPPGFSLASWDAPFTVALLRLLQLKDDNEAAEVLGKGRLRELYYAVLKGEAGDSARRAFGVGNEIARSIEYLSSRLNEPVTIEDLAAQVNMSRAVFHRKFKQATALSPMQFMKSMRLNSAAMMISQGTTVNEAAMQMGYASTSQFNGEFKRMYGQPPRRWSLDQKAAAL